MTELLFPILKNTIYRFDHWLEMTMVNVQHLQAMFPGAFVEFLHDCSKYTAVSEIPKHISVINFPLFPKPHHLCVEDSVCPWVSILWTEAMDKW